jgi:hypothetical protein
MGRRRIRGVWMSRWPRPRSTIERDLYMMMMMHLVNVHSMTDDYTFVPVPITLPTPGKCRNKLRTDGP